MPKSFTPRMTILTTSHLAFAFGLLGNIVSFLVFLAPLPTFYRIFKRKSTEGFQSIPYAVALFSAMLLLYYGFLKTDGLMIITINCIGCAIEALYLLLFMAYATREAKICTTKMLIFFNVGAYGLILVSTYRFSPPQLRVTIVGWICAVFSVGVFAAPLSIIRLVIRTKSVEYMPFPLSFLLTLCAIVWFFYGLLIKDFFVATPNVLGFVFGIAQMTLYIIYKKKGENKNRQVQPVGNQRPQADLTLTVIDLSTAGAGEIKPEMLKAAVRATAAAGGGGGGHHQIEDNTNNIVIVVMNEEDAVSKPIERIV